MALAMPVSSCELETKTPELATPPYWGLVPFDRLDHFMLPRSDALENIIGLFETQAKPIVQQLQKDEIAGGKDNQGQEQALFCSIKAVRIGNVALTSYQEQGAIVRSLAHRAQPRKPIMEALSIIQNGNHFVGEKHRFRSDIADQNDIVIYPLSSRDISMMEKIANIYKWIKEGKRHQNQ